MTADLLSEVCHNVTIKPPLQPLDGEPFTYRTANTDSGARLDIKARGFWHHGQDATLTLGFSTPMLQATTAKILQRSIKGKNKIKKRSYGQRVHDVENGIFTPLIFSTSGGMGRKCALLTHQIYPLQHTQD